REFAFDRIDSVASDYVEARSKHFTVLARQIVGSLLFKAFATVGVLGLGGLLVIDQQISLGQLVAAEIVIIMILGALEKLLSQFDLYYDLMAALDKLSIIADQPLEDIGGSTVPRASTGGEIDIRHLSLSIDEKQVLSNVNLRIDSRQHVSIVGESGAGKSTLLHVMLGLTSGHHGVVAVNGVDVKDADLTSLRKRIGMVFPENQIIPGTIEQNILLGRPFSRDDLMWAINMTSMQDEIERLPEGLRTVLHGTGDVLPYGLRRRILFARMIVQKPDVLLIDEAFDGIEDSVKLRMLDKLFSWPKWTIINVSHDPEVVRRTERCVVLQNGSIIQEGATRDLCQQADSAFCALFPDPRPFLHVMGGGSNG
ncbi:MAG: ATP-binding cassette domain-containing protein, partial [Candidatus Kapabacteria bacterium]|nr:ATP-binding cassette domain-containing protein [Candidatus Kapabacteria bacterium]